MKYKFKVIFFAIFSFSRCTQVATEEEAIEAKVPVTITSLSYGSVSDPLTLFATTLYLKRNVVTAPIPAYITQVFIKLGDHVHGGQILYSLETKERRAMGTQRLSGDSTFTSFGKIEVKAPSSGIVSTLDKQQVGDYVLEGTQLCTLAESSALSFSVNVPFEYTHYTKAGMKCSLVMPDSSVYTARFTTPLTTMNGLAQTQSILAKSDKVLFLPENLIVKVRVDKNSGGVHQLLPRTSILSDEMMREFWVMKLIDDSTAVKIPVSLGTKNHDRVEVLKPEFEKLDRFLVTGNYGLPDTAKVTITKERI